MELFKRKIQPAILCVGGLLFCNFGDRISSKAEKPLINIVKFSFKNVVDGKPLVLGDTSYINPFGEVYTIKKFRYYVTEVRLNTSQNYSKESNSFHLVDQKNPSSLNFSFGTKKQNYESLSFLLGVDSLYNVSGAQTGALDPANDMFWTWNSGYVMAKLEGNSLSSPLPNNLFEYHIGGFRGVNNVLKTITLNFSKEQSLKFSEDKSVEIIINANINRWWKNINEIKISTVPAITSPGALARKMSDNYSEMFSIVNVINY